MTHSSAQVKRNAGSLPHDSPTKTYPPPERGNAAASSEYVSAPHSTTTPPTIHASRNSGTSSMRCATPAGVRKIPLPMVEPTRTATALHRPRRRTSRSPQRSAGVMGADIAFANYTLTPPDLRVYSGRAESGSPGGIVHAAVPFALAPHRALAARPRLSNRKSLRSHHGARRPAVVQNHHGQPGDPRARVVVGSGPNGPGCDPTPDASAPHRRLDPVHPLPAARDARQGQPRRNQQDRKST